MAACFDLAPLPSMKDGTIACVASSGGVTLRAAVFTAKGAIKGTICLFPGRTEYIEKYAEVIGELRDRGFCVAVLDWRGQGGSDRVNSNRLKGHVGHYRDYDADLASFMSQVVEASCPKPYFSLAHSMGGLIIMRSVLQKKKYFSKCIFSSPFLDLAGGAPILLRTLAIVLHNFGFGDSLIPGAKLRPSFQEPFLGNKLTSDEARFNTMAAVGKMRPDLFIGAPTVGWVYRSLEAIDEIKHAPAATFAEIPLLFCVAMKDQVVSAQATVTRAASLKQATVVRLETSEHEALIEKDAIRAEFWQAFDRFMA